jgi:hypothetical protein
MTTEDAPEVKPPLAEWRRPKRRQFWADLHAEHGPVIALKLRQNPHWDQFDDEIRKACGALQDQPTEERGLYLGMFGGWTVIARDNLAGAVENLRAAGGLQFLEVRDVPAPEDPG